MSISSSSLPRSIPIEAYDAIREDSDRIEAEAINKGGNAWAEFQQDADDQELFLIAFEKSFSVKRSLKKIGISHAKYKKWREKSIYFVETFNSIIEMWGDDIFVSAANRAKGHLLEAPKDAEGISETESGYVEDAEGNVVYHGADTQLTKAFLRAMHPEQFSEKLDITSDNTVVSDNTMEVTFVDATSEGPTEDKDAEGKPE